ncbi:Uncharacterised protein [Mycobacteroides abscessus subsp. abscessus]|nr:Uncharacterised protein [Mycobacteroides abscessus subsp. abscessus]
MLDCRGGAYLAGPDHQHANTELTQGFSEAEVESIQAGLGGAVDEVGAAYPLAGDRGHRDDLPKALSLHLLADQHAHGDGGGVVHLCAQHRLGLVLP